MRKRVSVSEIRFPVTTDRLSEGVSPKQNTDSQRQPDLKFWRGNKWSQCHVPLKRFGARTRKLGDRFESKANVFHVRPR